ncbi:MAG: hypothetical protein JRJ85_28145 [Deltaproteobacteria bacterium]|nr:hypothetical protein [Deltaproteobacteria bacterium]
MIEKLFDVAGLVKIPYRQDPCALIDFKGLKSNNYIRSHYPPAVDVQMALEEKKGVYIIFNFRDPRDALVSWFHWVHRG